MTAAQTTEPPPLPRKGTLWLILARALNRLPVLAIFALIVIINTGGEAVWSYYSGVLWRYPGVYDWAYLSIVFNAAAISIFAVSGAASSTVRAWVNAVTVVLAAALGVFILNPKINFHDQWYRRGLKTAASHVKFDPVRLWATGHLPLRGDADRVEADIPESIWRMIPFTIKPYVSFQRLSPDADSWMLVIDNSHSGFVGHHGVILGLGKSANPQAAAERFGTVEAAAPAVWVFR